MQIKEVIRKGMIKLKTNGIDEPNVKARLLMQYILKKPREYILVYDKEELTLRQEVNYFKGIKKLIEGVPLQHITKSQEFMKLNFYVDQDVLIPRPDTEILVEEVIKIAKKVGAKKILDLCTGSGAIAVSLAKYIPNSKLTGVDISSKMCIRDRIDTGFGRYGFVYNKREEIIEALSNMKNIKIEGTFTHFSVSFFDDKYTKEQFDRFIDVVEGVCTAG